MKCYRIIQVQLWFNIFFRPYAVSTLWTKIKHNKLFLSYLSLNPVDSDKIWYTMSWINLRYSSLDVFRLTWIMLLHYLVKLSIRILLSEQQLELWTKNTPNFLSHRLQNPADSDKILYLYSWTYLLQTIINVFHLT